VLDLVDLFAREDAEAGIRVDRIVVPLHAAA
jgi:hypothetical protein